MQPSSASPRHFYPLVFAYFHSARTFFTYNKRPSDSLKKKNEKIFNFAGRSWTPSPLLQSLQFTRLRISCNDEIAMAKAAAPSHTLPLLCRNAGNYSSKNKRNATYKIGNKARGWKTRELLQPLFGETVVAFFSSIFQPSSSEKKTRDGAKKGGKNEDWEKTEKCCWMRGF